MSKRKKRERPNSRRKRSISLRPYRKKDFLSATPLSVMPSAESEKTPRRPTSGRNMPRAKYVNSIGER